LVSDTLETHRLFSDGRKKMLILFPVKYNILSPAPNPH